MNGPAFWVIRKKLFPLVHISTYLAALAKCLLVLAAVVMMAWVLHLQDSKKWWNEAEKNRLMVGLNCESLLMNVDGTGNGNGNGTTITAVLRQLAANATTAATAAVVVMANNTTTTTTNASAATAATAADTDTGTGTGAGSSSGSSTGVVGAAATTTAGTGTGTAGSSAEQQQQQLQLQLQLQLHKNAACGQPAFILWVSPLVTSLVLLVFGVVCHYLSKSMSKQQSRFVALRVFATVLMMLLCAIYVAASTAGARMHMSNAVTSISTVGLMLLGFIVGSTVGWQQLQMSIASVPLVRTMIASVYSDWCKALFIMLCWPMLLLYFMASIMNQFCRRHFSAAKRFESKAEADLWLTQTASEQWEMITNWQWSSILVKVQYVGVGLVSCSVGIGIMVTLFLSWLNMQLANSSLLMISLIFVAVGLAMFLLPPVPGVPVYISSGIIITKAAVYQVSDY
jgi:hypothetical protein